MRTGILAGREPPATGIAAKTKDPAARPGDRDHVLALCHMLSNRIGKAFASELAPYRITVAQWRVMLTLALHRRACGRDIADRWAMDKMAVSRAVAGLRERGLVGRRRNREDRRAVDLMLTRSGHALYRALLPAADRRYRRLMAGLAPPEAEALGRIMKKLIAHVDTVID